MPPSDLTRLYSERELALPDLWWTGEEWRNGTAQRGEKQRYDEAVKEKQK